MSERKNTSERELIIADDNAPPNSRLFIVCGKELTEDDFREAFDNFGTIEKVEIHRDRNGESKGIAYLKYSKTSEAAEAVEQLNGRCIAKHPRPLKVLIASNKEEGRLRYSKEDDRFLRLFVVVSKDQVESELKEYFNNFGAVHYVNIVKDRETRLSKGFAYIKYYRLIHAAKAFETCDRSYKPVFADPRPLKDNLLNGFASPRTTDDGYGSDGCSLTIYCSLLVNEDQLWRLFDLIPGLDYCELKRKNHKYNRCEGIAVYVNPKAALYAMNKLHGFEYPPGERLIVKLQTQRMIYDNSCTNEPAEAKQYQCQPADPQNQNLKSLTDTIAQATNLIKSMNMNERSVAYTYDPSYCSITLPPPQPFAPIDSNVNERLFVVCTPSPPPIYAVKDVFGRFGGLIDFYFLSGKRCGYALFNLAESASEAMCSLNGQEICGSRMKVMFAEPMNRNKSCTE